MIYTLAIVLLMGTPNIHDLIEAKRWDAAEAQLGSISPDARPRFEGLIAQGRGDPAEAAKAFERALMATPGIPQLHLHAAHAYFKLKQFEAVLRHAQAASSLKAEAVAQPLLESRALEGLNRDTEAYVVLKQACETFTDTFRPCLELAVLTHRKKLPSEVRYAVNKVLALDPDRDTALGLFHLLYGDRDALAMLEQIVARYPKDAELRAHLGHVYAGKRQWYSAARLFEGATSLGGQYAFEAADQYRMAGRYRHALRMNGQALFSQDQAAQRLAILFEHKQYARIVAMDTQFKAPGSRYRVAYAHYAVGDYAEAKLHSTALLDTSYGEEATALLKAMRSDLAQ